MQRIYWMEILEDDEGNTTKKRMEGMLINAFDRKGKTVVAVLTYEATVIDILASDICP